MSRRPANGRRPKRREVVAGDELVDERLGGVRSGAPHADLPDAGLERRDVLELRRVLAQVVIKRVGVDREPSLQSAEHAAVVAVAEADDALPGRRTGSDFIMTA